MCMTKSYKPSVSNYWCYVQWSHRDVWYWGVGNMKTSPTGGRRHGSLWVDEARASTNRHEAIIWTYDCLVDWFGDTILFIQNRYHCLDGICEEFFLSENCCKVLFIFIYFNWSLLRIHLYNKWALVQISAWYGHAISQYLNQWWYSLLTHIWNTWLWLVNQMMQCLTITSNKEAGKNRSREIRQVGHTFEAVER